LPPFCTRTIPQQSMFFTIHELGKGCVQHIKYLKYPQLI
jgi:hypothetical protein